MQLIVYRNGLPQATIKSIDENTVFTQKLMGEHKIECDAIVSEPLGIQIGDYIEHAAELYYINTATSIEKINNFTYRYQIAFEGEIYHLYNKIFMDEGQADFSYHGTPEDFLLLLLTNINSTQSGWTIASVYEAPAQTLSFSDDSCRSALTKIAEAFELEYRLAGKAIYLQKSVGNQTTLQFEYGRGLGLYALNRNRIDDKNIVTRVYGFGARRNIDTSYRDGATRLVFGSRYLENNVPLYGVREGSITFEDIYPQRAGTVTDVNADNSNQFTDSNLNFDINDYLIEGTTAKVVFKTGALAGYEFEIDRYQNASKTIDVLTFEEQNGYELPNNLNKPLVGDKYTLVDIRMPQIYINEAETELEQRTQQYMEENSMPRVTYTLEIDEKYVRERGFDLKVGDLVRVLDTKLGVNSRIRVIEVTYPLVNVNQVTVVISDTIPYTIQERLISDTIDNNSAIVNVDRKRAELARRASARFRKLQDLVFDPDGYFDTEKIKPASIETLMLAVGAKSQNFGLMGVTIQANADGNANILKISSGKLVHYEIEIDGLGYIWNMDPQVFTNLVTNNAYYVYAKCSRTSLTGIWEVSAEPRRTEDVNGYYLFNLGILYPVTDGRRDFDFTNGMSFINGDTITTGTIKSIDDLNYFNLGEGKFKIGSTQNSLDWNVSEAGQLTIKGNIKAHGAEFEGASIKDLIVRNLKTREEGRRLEILEKYNNMILYDQQGKEVIRVDDDIDISSRGTLLGGVKATNPDNGRVSYMSGNGVFSNSSNTRFFAASTGISSNASVVGILTRILSGISAATVGINGTGNANGLGGYFYGGLKIEGGGQGLSIGTSVHVNIRKITNSTSLSETDHVISCYNTKNITVWLPANPRMGRRIEIRRNNSSNVVVHGNGKKILAENLLNQKNAGESKGDRAVLVYDGYWLYNNIYRH